MAAARLVGDRFEIHELAGSGGAASVYRATDRHNRQTVALKLLRSAPDSEALDRFAREAELLAKVSHGGVVRYVTHGHAGGDLYLAMEWLEGVTLGQRLKQQPLTIDESIAVGRGAAEALAAAHARGIVHRDVKPANIFLVEGDPARVKLLDFGIARLLSSTTALTQPGLVIGTPSYMAPEQARGDEVVDARADVFALGCVIYRCLTGKKAFDGADMRGILAKVLLEHPRPVAALRPEVPPALADLVGQMLCKHAGDRPPDAGAIARALAALESLDEPPTMHIAPSLTTEERWMMCILLSRAPSAGGAAGHDTLRAAVASQGGHLHVLADRSLLVTLEPIGTPGDHATRAARCALAIRSWLPDLPMVLAAGEAEMKGPVAIGPVIDRGTELLRDLGRDGIIRLDDVVAGFLDGRFEVAHGDDGFVLEGERDAPAAARGFLGRASTCVGRERDLAMLEGIWEECVEESVARIVLLTGAPGIGKSRVLDELMRRIGERHQAEIWIGCGDPMSARSPFGMIAGPIRHAAGIESGDALPERQQRLRARVSEAVAADDAARITEFLAEIIGAPFVDSDSVELAAARQDPQLMGDQLRRAWEDWLDAESRRRPILLVLEDLHWGDLPSVGFVDTAVRHLADRPLMVLALARPEIYEWCPNIWNERSLTELRLGRLTQKAARRLVAEALGKDAGDPVVERLVERGEGNPFFLEELVRAAITGKGGELPTTVLGMVQARLTRLSPDARRLLRAASIFGRVFPIDGVFALLGEAGADRYAWLSELVARDVVERPRDARHRGEASFHHALIHEAAYAMLTEADRSLGHRLAAAWLEAGGQADPMVLAEHFERGEELGRAMGWYWRAAAQALEGNDHEAAIARVDKAVACGAHGEDEGALRLIESEAQRWRGDNELSKAAAQRAMQLSAKGSANWCAAASELAAVCGSLGDVDDLVRLAMELEAVEPLAHRSQLVNALARVARPLFWSGKHALGSRVLARAAILEHDAAGLPPTALASLYMARGVEARLMGNPSACVRFNEHAVMQSERAGDFRGRCAAAGNLGYAYLEIGAYREAEAALRSALATAERLRLPRVAATAQQNLGLAVGRRGGFEEAVYLECTSYAAFEAQGDARRAGCSLLYLATVELWAQHLADAERTARRAAEMLTHNPPLRCNSLALLAQVELARGDVARAMRNAAEAHAAFTDLGGIDEGESRVRLMYAEALHAFGEIERARAALADAHRSLLDRARKIPDERRREGFLTAIPEHARTLELARAWNVVGGSPLA